MRESTRYLWNRDVKRGVERVEESFGQREMDTEAEKESSEVPEGTRLVTIFLCTLILNISGHLEIKILLFLLVYT